MQIAPEQLEKYSSAVTLSDMEVFVFPELMYSLVLANIMSPIIWRWRDEDCFKKLEGKSPYKKLLRLRQYIMDEYEFNLDLETWGLTSKAKQLKRFEPFISPEDITKSNALFGYHGDKYYFDVDIRKHFGLDKYDSDIIPYWKTETVEAMDAFIYRPGYSKKAGECVSLSALYAAAAFIVCGVPLDDIFMVLTPLHSQNFIDVADGVLTNNRRLVTKAMWFNGTAISNKAQRALRNENVTTVAHNTGCIHCLYGDATIDQGAYQRLCSRLGRYLSTDIDLLMIANFLRTYLEYHKYFQFCHSFRGQQKFINAEVIYHYEHGSNFRIADATFDKLINEISEEDFSPYELPGRICCEKLRNFIQYENIDLQTDDGRTALKNFLNPFVPETDRFVRRLADFIRIEANLPAKEKNYIATTPIEIPTDFTKEQIVDYLQSIRTGNGTADLAVYAFRDMETCDWRPFVTAAIERNPVNLEKVGSMSADEAYQWLGQMDDASIYDGKRLAQPDEVANYKRGDGLEKAFALANVLRNKEPNEDIRITVDNSDVVVKGRKEYRFVSDKRLQSQIQIAPDGSIDVHR